MPIALDTPIASPAITKKEVTSFFVDLNAGRITINFASITASGTVVGETPVYLPLYDANGAPRFTGAEYASIKSAIYRLAIESGAVAGVVE